MATRKTLTLLVITFGVLTLLTAVAVQVGPLGSIADAHTVHRTQSGAAGLVQLLEQGSNCADDYSVCIAGDFRDEGAFASGCVEATSYDEVPSMGGVIYDAADTEIRRFDPDIVSRRTYYTEYRSGTPRPYYLIANANVPGNYRQAVLDLTAD